MASILGEFERRFVRAMESLRVGDPMEESTELGPLASRQILETLDDQVRRSLQAGARLLTGGEPMLYAELIPLAAALQASAWHITIETAGTVWAPVVCDLMSISPKLANSTPHARVFSRAKSV